MAVSCDNHCVIEKLLQTPFSSLSYNEKLKIIDNNKLQSKHSFLDEVIDVFAKKNR
jgi:hypothetical protein